MSLKDEVVLFLGKDNVNSIQMTNHKPKYFHHHVLLWILHIRLAFFHYFCVGHKVVDYFRKAEL